MSVYFQLSEIHSVSCLNSKIVNHTTDIGNQPHTLYNFNNISNWEPRIGALNVVWFSTSYASTIRARTPYYAKSRLHSSCVRVTSLRGINSMLIRYIRASITYTQENNKPFPLLLLSASFAFLFDVIA